MRSRVADSRRHQKQDFSKSHHQQIRMSLRAGSVPYTLAVVTLTHSVSICTDLIKFLDELVRKLAKSKFSYQKGLHVASRLLRRIYTEIYVPRMGVARFFRAGDMSQIMSAHLWSCLRSLTIAMEYHDIGFNDLDIVSSEITKFLLVNTGYDSIVKLEEKVERLEKERKDATSSLKGAVATANTASNKADEMKKLIAALDKRVKALE